MFNSKVKLLILMACFSVCLLCGTVVFALGTQNFSGNVNITYSAPKEFFIMELNSTGNGWVVKGYNEDARKGLTALQIPDTYTKDGKTLPVTEIGDSAFEDATVFTSLKLGNNITKIGNSAFSGCNGISGSLSLPINLTQIGDDAFYSCSGITGTINISRYVSSIGASPFCGCGISKIIVDSSNSYYTSRSSSGSECNIIVEKSSGTLIQGCNYSTIPNDNTIIIIGDSAFSNCTKLSGTLTIPDSVTSIGRYAFNFCRELSGQLILPNTIQSIGSNAFSACTFKQAEIYCNLNSSQIFSAVRFDSVKIGAEVTSVARNCFGLGTINDLIVDSPTIYKDIAKSSSLTGWGYTMKSGMTIKILQTADDGTNAFLNDSSQFTQSTTKIDGQDYNVYTYN